MSTNNRVKNARKQLYEIIECKKKSSIGNKIYNTCLIAIILVSMISLCTKAKLMIFNQIEIVACFVFFIDYIFRWMTADYKYRYKKISAKRAFLIYPFRLHAIIDLLSFISALPVLFPVIKTLRYINVFKAVRVLKCIRIFKLLKYSSNFDIIYEILRKQKKVLTSVGMIAIAYIFTSAVIVFQIEPETFPTFFDAIYWAVISLTTVGYGDIYPVSEVGRFFSMLSSIFGITFVALPAGIISAGYLEIIMNQNKK